MGRQGPRLVPFLQSGLKNKKFRNLIAEDPLCRIFSIILPHKTKKLNAEDELIFKAWYELNGKKYIFGSKHYTDAKQAMTASLRKSDYVEKVHVSEDKLTYRILNKVEVKEKKRLKKELKKKREMEKAVSDDNDASSTAESGYGTGGDSPRNESFSSTAESGYGSGGDSPRYDYEPIQLNDNSAILDGNGSVQVFYANETNSSVERDGLWQSSIQPFPKYELVDALIAAGESLAAFDVPNLPDSDLAKIQSIANNIKSECYLFENNTIPPAEAVELMDCSSENQNPELNSFNMIQDQPVENDYLQLDNILVEDLNNILPKNGSILNFNSSVPYMEGIKKNVTEMQNIDAVHSEPRDILTDELFNKLMEEFSASNYPSSMPSAENKEQISSLMDAGVSACKAEETGKIYLCNKWIHLGKTPVLLCEPQFETITAEASGDIQLIFDETVLKEFNGLICVKDYHYINNHLMVILEPNDE